MARVAVCTVVDVTVNCRMFRVGLCLRMARGAREDRIVRRIGVARRADTVGTSVTCREPRMIERRSRPTRRRVARLTRRRKSRRCVVRVRRACIIRAVTLVAA